MTLRVRDGEVALDRLRRRAQRRHEVAAQLGDRDAAGERADVGRRDDAAGDVADRRGGRAQAALELLVDDRVALAAHAVELVAQRGHGGPGGGRQRGQLDALQVAVELVGVQAGEQDAAHARRVGRQPRSDRHGHVHDARRRYAGHAQRLVAVEHGHRAELVGRLHQLLQVRAGDVGQRQPRAIAVPEVEQLGREREPAPVAAQVAELLEREQCAPGARARHPDRPRDLGEREPAARMPERGDDGQPALDGAHEVRVA